MATKNKNKILVSRISIPAFILRDRSVSVLEKITEHLKEDKNLTYHEIAQILGRDDRTIWTVYNRVGKKRKKISRSEAEKKIRKTKKSIRLPTKVLADRTVSILESIVEYLKEEKSMTYHEIAVLLGRDDRTIWTVYYRASKKRENAK